MTFRPRLWPTVFTIPAVLLMLGLGTWQLQRLAWKTEIITQFDERVAAEAVSPPAEIGDINDWRFRRVAASGVFLNDKELHLIGKAYNGTAGFHVITPFLTADGLTIFVNRGWVPSDRRRAADRPQTLIEGETKIEGLVRETGVKGRFVPDNEPQNDIWFTINPEPMAEHLDLAGPIASYSIDVLRDSPRPTRLPFGAKDTIEVRNEHLQYAITWFSLALTLIVVYVLWHRSLDRKEQSE